MKKADFFKKAVLSLACLGMALPQQAFAANPVTAPATGKVQIADVALTQGTLSGKVVNTHGELLDGSKVTVHLGNQEVGSAITNQTGEFTISNLSSGIYQVSAGETQSPIRLWDANAAPPTARNNVLLVSGSTVRGQNRLPRFSRTTTAVVLGTVIIAGTTIAIVESNNDDDDPAPVSP